MILCICVKAQVHITVAYFSSFWNIWAKLQTIVIFMFKFVKGMLPPMFYNMFLWNYEIRDCLTRSRDKFYVPTSSQKSLGIVGPRLWNNIGESIDHLLSLHTSYHEFHETCHSVTFIVLVNSHQRWKQTRNRVCFHLWCELTLVLWCHSIIWCLFSWNEM